jgi:hypothetical protein
MKKVYISATYMDLKDHRSAVAHALRKMNYDVRCMEDYLATDERTDVRCRQDVASCDFYVGIIPQRYGWIPPSADRSITEQEYLEARRHPDKTRCLMFLLGEGAEWQLKRFITQTLPRSSRPFAVRWTAPARVPSRRWKIWSRK